MAVRSMEIQFENTFKGVAKAPNADISIGINQGDVAPYDMLFAALASCLYATLLDVLEKKKITFDQAVITVTGEKRTSIPATLEWVNVEFKIMNPSKDKGVDKSVELATKYCSIYQTIAQVASMTFETIIA